MSNKDIEICRKELLDVAKALDVNKFRAFYNKWYIRGMYDVPLSKNLKVVELAYYKMVCNLNDVPEYVKKRARAILKAMGSSEEICRSTCRE